jgi:hypothetical protein
MRQALQPLPKAPAHSGQGRARADRRRTRSGRSDHCAGDSAYGVNTGVGALVDRAVEPALQRRLSRQLIMSHACGIGAPLPEAEVRAIIAAQANNHAHGRSGVRIETVKALLALLAHRIVPEVLPVARQAISRTWRTSGWS